MTALYEEVRAAAPYAGLSWEDFEAVVDFVATGGYALRAYERFAKIVQGRRTGCGGCATRRVAQQYRMNVGTIVEATMIKVRLAGAGARASPARSLPRGGRVLGEIEEYFAETMTPGDTFLFAGEVLRFEGIHEDEVAGHARERRHRPEDPVLRGRQVPALDLPRRARAPDPRRPVRMGPAAAAARRMAALQQRRRSVAAGARATSWSRPFRAPAATTSPAFPSRAASRTRPSACC